MTSTQYPPESLYVAPTIVIGLGGTGVEVMRLVKQRVRQSLNPVPRLIEFLAVDTEMPANPPGQERVYDNEFAYIGDYNAGTVLDNLDKHPHIAEWWPTAAGAVRGTIYKGARQRRCVGRLSLYKQWGEFFRKLKEKLQPVQELIEKERTQRREVATDRSKLVQIFIVASVCGGTGSATLLDVAFRARHMFGDEADITGFFLLPSCFLPEIQSQIQQQRIQANAYTALKELNHFMTGHEFKACFPDQPFLGYDGKPNQTSLYRPYDLLRLVDRSNGVERLSTLDGVRRMTAQQIFLELAHPVGKQMDSRRANLRDLSGERAAVGKDQALQTLAVSGFVTASLYLPDVTPALNEITAREIDALAQNDACQPKLEPLVVERAREIREALRFVKVQSSKLAEPTNQLDDLIFGSGPVAEIQIDLTGAANIVRGLYSRVQADFVSADQLCGPAGVIWLAEKLVTSLREQREQLEQRQAGLLAAIEQLNAAINETEPATGLGRRFIDWIGGLFARGQTASERRAAERAAEQQQLLLRRKNLETERSRDQIALSTLERLVRNLNNIARVLGERLASVRTAAHSVTEPLDGILADAELFDLATPVGNDEYFTKSDGHVSDMREQIWSAYVKDRAAVDLNISQTLWAQFRQNGLTTFVLEDSADGQIELNLSVAPMGAAEAFCRGVRTAGARYLGLSLVGYLDWFHRHVRYGTQHQASPHTPIDPVGMLRDRARLPFLEIDDAQLGTEWANNTEPIRLLGVAQARSRDEVAAKVLADFDTFEDVETGLPGRLDVSLSIYGFPMKALKNLGELKKHYLHFQDQLHIHRTWPNDDGNGDAMDDPI